MTPQGLHEQHLCISLVAVGRNSIMMQKLNRPNRVVRAVYMCPFEKRWHVLGSQRQYLGALLITVKATSKQCTTSRPAQSISRITCLFLGLFFLIKKTAERKPLAKSHQWLSFRDCLLPFLELSCISVAFIDINLLLKCLLPPCISAPLCNSQYNFTA